MRTIAIGDVHGCSKALRSLLELLQLQQHDRLVFLGDYVDRGPDSRGVLDFLLQVREQCEAYFLLGNHDIMFRGVMQGLDPELWLQIGGQPTVASYGGKLSAVRPAHRDFLESCLPYLETESHIFLHANYLPDLPMSSQPEEKLFWEHLTVRMPAPHYSGKHVVCGHTPQADGEVARHGHLTCIDTACYAGKWLTALCVETGQVWQVSREGHPRSRSWLDRWRTRRHR